MASRTKRFLRHALSRPTAVRASRVAIPVAPVLLLMNHADAVIDCDDPLPP